jgi:methionine--tRNA ligase beta chain
MIELRVGRIKTVDDIEGARSQVYRLTVYLGEEIGTRQLVAGIKGKYTREELLEREIIVVVNLEPKRIANVESQGMLLAASSADKLALLAPDKEMPEGSKIF